MLKIPYEVIEHTSDVALRIYGETISDLFLNGLKGLFYLVAPRLTVCQQPFPFPPPPQMTKIELSAPTQEELLVYWLNEFIYYFYVRRLFPYLVNIESLESDSLAAAVNFRKRSQVFPIELEIKAATYHNLAIRKKSGQYQSEVVFDV